MQHAETAPQAIDYPQEIPLLDHIETESLQPDSIRNACIQVFSQRTQKKCNGGGSTGPYRPTPQDIRKACERLQAEWSPRERAKRAGYSPKVGWTPPQIDCSDLSYDDDGGVGGVDAQRSPVIL